MMGHSLEYEEFSEVMAEALDNEVTNDLSIALRNQLRAALWKLWTHTEQGEFVGVLERIAGEHQRINDAREKGVELAYETRAS